jgi:L-cystine transport system substrate-binding protein
MLKNIKLLFIIGLSLFLAACGQGGESGGTNESTEGDSPTQITAAVENASQPLSYTDENGNLTGYEVELLQAINEEMTNYEIGIESVDSEATQVGLDTGRYEMVGGGLYKTPEREELYLFPEKHTGASIITIYTRADDDSIQSLDDLSDVTVHPVTPNGGIFNLLTSYNEENPDNQIDIQLGESGNFAQRFQALDEGASDAVVMPSNLGAEEIIDELGLNVTPVEEPVQVNPTYFMLSPDQEELKTELDEAIQTLKEDGTLSQLSEEWYGEDMFEYEVTE